MPTLTSRKRHRRARRAFILVERPGPATLGGLIAAAALMAQADGEAGPEERRGLLRFLRSRGLLPQIGRKTVIAAYEAELARWRTGREPSEATARHLDGLAGSHAVSLIATAAAHIAIADGRIAPEELRALRDLRERLGLPGEDGLTPAA